MYVVLALLNGDSAHRGAGLLPDAVQAAARPGDGLLHVFAQPVPDGAELALFINAPSSDAALRSGTRLCMLLCADRLDGAILRHCETAGPREQAS